MEDIQYRSHEPQRIASDVEKDLGPPHPNPKPGTEGACVFCGKADTSARHQVTSSNSPFLFHPQWFSLSFLLSGLLPPWGVERLGRGKVEKGDRKHVWRKNKEERINKRRREVVAS